MANKHVTAVDEILSGVAGEYVVYVACGAAFHGLMIGGERRYTSRETIVCDAENMARRAETARWGLESDDYGTFVQIGIAHDSHVRGGANARPDYYKKVYLVPTEAVL